MTEPAEAVAAAVKAMWDDEKPPPPPRDTEAMISYWDRRGGTPALAAALGDPPTRRPARGENRDSYRRYDARRRQIQRWRTGARHPPKRELTRLRRATNKLWRKEHPRPSRRTLLLALLTDGAIIDFSGLVRISDDTGHRHNVSLVSRGGTGTTNLARFVENALDEDWDQAADDLAQAWNDVYGIPAHIAWVDVDHLQLEASR
jgi:hypothetical protein